MSVETRIPVNANPMPNMIPRRINPKDKKRRKSGLSFKEVSEFNGVCAMESWQLLECYSFYDCELSRDDFENMCKFCPYSSSTERKATASMSDKFPYFICEKFPDDVYAETPWGYVYFISDGQYVKIGVAKNVTKRLYDLQTANAKELSILLSIPCNSQKAAYGIETFLHNVYSRFRLCGEWFNILDYIVLQEFKNCFCDL